MIEASKKGDVDSTNILKLAIASIKNAEIAKGDKLSDEEIMYAMYPMRRALIRYGRRTYTEQVEFAEKMARLNLDPRFDDLDAEIDDEDEDTYIPPQSAFPSKGEEEDIVPAMEDEETEE